MQYVIIVDIWYILFFQISADEEVNNFGVLYAEDVTDSNNHGSYCMMYNPRFKAVPTLLQEAVSENTVEHDLFH